MPLNNFFLLTLLLMIETAFAGPVTKVLPTGSAFSGALATGNTLSPKCDGKNPDTIRFTFFTSCYGTNLRGDRDPISATGDINMSMKIARPGAAGASFDARFKFPAGVIKSETEYKLCNWVDADGDGTREFVDCPMHDAATGNITLTRYDGCQNQDLGGSQGRRLSECRKRNSTLVGPGEIECAYIYYGATSTFNTSQVSCLFVNKDDTLGSQVIVNDASGAPINSIAYAAPGKVDVTLLNVNIPKPSWSIGSDGRVVQSGTKFSFFSFIHTERKKD